MLFMVCGLFCVAVIIALPLVDVEIAVRCPAFVRPSAEISVIRSPHSGRVSENFLYENKQVQQGEALLTLESPSLSEQENSTRTRIESRKKLVADLRTIISTIQMSRTHLEIEKNIAPILQSDLYHRSYARYQQRIIESLVHHQKARQDFDRNSTLFKQRVIPASEFEHFQYELDRSENALTQIKEDQLTEWSSELKNLAEEQNDLESQLARTVKERATLTIHAPVKGSVQNLAGIYPGSFVYANQELGEISPDTGMVVIAYVQPSDIGLIRHAMPVRMQVNSFNYNQWGMAEGQVLDVPQDIKVIDNKPVFEVRCSLDKTYLQLKNGYRGFLKKGMSLQARFIVTRRSLWQLLYDKVDNWVNPHLASKGL